MKKLVPALVSFGERWLIGKGWRRTVIVACACVAYAAFHMVAILTGGLPPFFFTFNFFLIVLFAASMGVWGGLAAATVSGLVWGPFVTHFIGTEYGPPAVIWVIRLLVFQLFGLLSGAVIAVFRYQIRKQRETTELLLQAQKLETIGRMTGGIAHDFNNMLTAIGGYAELLVKNATPNPRLTPLISELMHVVGRSADLVHQLLAVSRRRSMNTRPLDIDGEIRSLGKVLRRILGDNIRLQLHLAGDDWTVEADPVQIDQIVMNLAVNAVDAMPNGGSITIRTRPLSVDAVFASQHQGLGLGDHVMLSVSDTGTGIDEEVSRHLFEPFFTTKESGKGTGLGLPTVYGIVRQLKGDMWFQSDPGRGTTFNICLPRARSDGTHRDEGRTRPGQARRGRGNATVLIAEDNDAVRVVVTRLLKHEGYRVVAVEDGEEAIRIIEDESQPIDLLITDLVMPGIAGVKVLEAVSSIRPSTGVIVISGNIRDERDDTAITVLADRFLEKPFTGDQLLTTAHQILG